MRHELEQAPVVGLLELVQQPVDRRTPPSSVSRASSLPATAITSSMSSARTTLIAATSKPASWVTPSAISWSASRDAASDQLVARAGRDVARCASATIDPRLDRVSSHATSVAPAPQTRRRSPAWTGANGTRGRGRARRLEPCPSRAAPRKGGDGRLTAALDPHEQGPQDACGVFGVWAPGEDVAKLTYFGLYALQHRGQESAGIAVSNGRQILVYKDMGLVSQVFDETTLASLKGHLAIGHCRYSTTGASTWQNAQPTFRPTADGSIALGHNGNLINTHELRADGRPSCPARTTSSTLHTRPVETSTNDTSLVTALLAHHPDTSLEQRALEVLPLLRGAFCFVWMNEDTLYAARDPQGIRPLVLGRLDRGWVVASEDAALATIGASVVREVEPGELIVIDENGLRSHRFAEPAPQGLRLRVRLPGPPRRHHQRPQRARGARRDGPAAGPRVPGRGRPGDAGARVRHARRRRATPRRAASRSARASSRTPTSAAPSSSPARPCASSASGSSSTRSST